MAMLVSGRVPSLKLTFSPLKITIFPGKYHQNCGFSMAMLVSGRVPSLKLTFSHLKITIFPGKYHQNCSFREGPSLKLTFSPLKMDGLKMIVSFWGVSAYFQGRTRC